MPTQKYFNLKEERKEQIIKASINEFSIYDYESASINRIIKQISMPRGTFYLYFKDKEDLYLYLLRSHISTFKNIFIKSLKENDNNIFETIKDTYQKIIDKQENALYIKRMYINMNSKQLSITLKELIKEEISGKVILLINTDKYNINDEEKECLLTLLITTLIWHLGAYFDTRDKDIKNHLEKTINIIERGL